MKLKCKIKDKYMKQILSGEKKTEYRQIESIIFVDEQGQEYEFEVRDIIDIYGIYSKDEIDEIKKKYPDVPWNDNLLTVAIELGERIK